MAHYTFGTEADLEIFGGLEKFNPGDTFTIERPSTNTIFTAPEYVIVERAADPDSGEFIDTERDKNDCKSR